MSRRKRATDTKPSDRIVREVHVADLVPSPFQQRRFGKATTGGIVELAKSIDTNGLLQPIVIRPIQKGFEIIAGERRVRAVRKLKRPVIDAIVRELNDDQAEELHAIENLQREDLHPLEEAFTLRGLLGREGATVQGVAKTIGRSIGFVSRRARLTKLSDGWLAILADPEHPINAHWKASHLEAIARIEPTSQDAILKRSDETHGNWFWRTYDLRDVERMVGEELHELKRAPWKPSDGDLVPDAGPCSRCPKRASQDPGLFDDVQVVQPGQDTTKIPRGDRCLDAGCWETKLRAHVLAVVTAKRATHGAKLTLIGRNGYSVVKAAKLGGKVVDEWGFEKCKKSTARARPCVRVYGPAAGEFGWWKPSRGRSLVSSRTPGQIAAEKRNELARRRANHAIAASAKLLAKVKPKDLPPIETLLALVEADYYETPKLAARIAAGKPPTKVEVDAARLKAWASVTARFSSAYQGTGSPEWKVAAAFLALAGIDGKELRAAALKAHPPAAKKTTKKTATTKGD